MNFTDPSKKTTVIWISSASDTVFSKLRVLKNHRSQIINNKFRDHACPPYSSFLTGGQKWLASVECPWRNNPCLHPAPCGDCLDEVAFPVPLHVWHVPLPRHSRQVRRLPRSESARPRPGTTQ